MTPLAVAGFGAAAYLVIVALLVGSFINLAADRLPRGESLIRPRSHCRSCGRVLDLTDLVPVAGYLIRRGRCATCGAPIGLASPAVEAACGASMLAALGWFGLGLGAVAGATAVLAIGLGGVTLAFWRRQDAVRRRGSRSG
jgi:prepilin signal peptidase PulO-like enzyme (type II secretory pathway)